MATNKHIINDKRMPSFYVLATIAVFIALCLIGMWILSNPSGNDVANQLRNGPMAVDEVYKEKTSIDIHQEFGESNSKNLQKNEEMADGTSQLELPESRTKEKERTEYTDRGKESNEEDSKHDESNGEKTSLNVEKPKKESGLEENGGAQSQIQIENKENTNNWETQETESKKEKSKVHEVVIEKTKTQSSSERPQGMPESQSKWKLCSFEGAIDYIPCLDNKEAIRILPSTKHYEHRERHCPSTSPSCLVPLPEGYRKPIKWPQSRNEVFKLYYFSYYRHFKTEILYSFNNFVFISQCYHMHVIVSTCCFLKWIFIWSF